MVLGASCRGTSARPYLNIRFPSRTVSLASTKDVRVKGSTSRAMITGVVRGSSALPRTSIQEFLPCGAINTPPVSSLSVFLWGHKMDMMDAPSPNECYFDNIIKDRHARLSKRTRVTMTSVGKGERCQKMGNTTEWCQEHACAQKHGLTSHE